MQIDCGVCVKDSNSNYHYLTGNMTGSLLAEFILSQTQVIPSNGFMVKSIVSSNLIDAIANKYNVKLDKVLTGFKWIANKILEYETNNTGKFIFGYEESIGFLTGDKVRDKDSIVALAVLTQALCYAKSMNKTLWDYLLDIYETYGYYVENSNSISFPGIEGQEKMKKMMDSLRENPLKEVGKYKVNSVIDYMLDTQTGLPKSNVIYYELENNGWVCVRPSGTEPKIKFYFGLKGTSLENAESIAGEFKIALDELVKKL